MKKISLNINGDLPSDELIERVRIAEEAGIKEIWIGELELFQNPVEVADKISSETDAEVCILLSPSRRSCSKIVEVAKKYRTGLIPGRDKKIEPFIKCLEKVKDEAGRVYAGVSGKKITEISSVYADGLLLNYVYPEYIEWIKSFIARDIPALSFGPSLVLPSNFYEDLLIAASIVMRSNEEFLKNFNLYELAKNLPTEYSNLIKLKQEGKSVAELREFKLIEKHSEVLLNNFTISGNLKEVSERINEILRICDGVVLGDPFFRDIDSLSNLKKLNFKTSMEQR